MSERAKIIATALARSAAHHRKTALLGALIALGACGLAVVAGRPEAKGAALCIAIAFAVVAFRSQRLSARFIHPDGSPVLEAIVKDPGAISRITHDQARRCVVIHRGSHELAVRVDDATPAGPLIEALAEHAPNAERA